MFTGGETGCTGCTDYPALTPAQRGRTPEALCR